MGSNKKEIKKGILVAFGELFLKSKSVRKNFLQKLANNINLFLSNQKLNFKLYRFYERFFIETDKIKKTKEIVKNIFGISWIGEAFFIPVRNFEEIINFIEKNYIFWIKKDDTFAIRLKNSFIKKNSKEIIDRIAKVIKRKVDLNNPQKEIFIEIRKNGCFIYFKKEKGKGGLPFNTEGKVLSLISGGIDSPVASYLMLKRGAENVWLHFHSFPLVSNKSIEKIKELAEIFLRYQPYLKIYFLPFKDAQVEIKTKIMPKYRVILYRRLMFKIAEMIAKKENCLALVTGESLGQVSSQTLININIIEKGIDIPIFRPLISMNKDEIINLSNKIKTFLISIKPQEDCCTIFTPKHSSAQADINTIKLLEKKLNTDKIIKNIIKNAEIKEYRLGDL
jgi:thiamine biosynthesis protein ThiI